MSTQPNREIEIKFAFETEQDFQRFVSLFGDRNKFVVQTNYYLDTEDGSLCRMGLVVRLREACGKFLLTAKGLRNIKTEGLFDVLEFEVEVGQKEGEKLLKGVCHGEAVARYLPELPSKVKEVLASKRLTLLTKSRTRRFKVVLGKGVEGVADETMFENGRKDYEVEVESDDTVTAREVLMEALKLCGAKAVAQTMSKFERAMTNRIKV